MVIEGNEYSKLLNPSTSKDTLLSTDQHRLKCGSLELTQGKTVNKQDQQFIGYISAATKIEDIGLAYDKIHAIHPEARHIVCSWSLPGRDSYYLKDFCDDDEHGTGAYLLKLLLQSNIQNRAIFVIQHYNSSHIGIEWFTAMKEAVISAINRAPINKYTGLHDKIEANPTKSNKLYASVLMETPTPTLDHYNAEQSAIEVPQTDTV